MTRSMAMHRGSVPISSRRQWIGVWALVCAIASSSGAEQTETIHPAKTLPNVLLITIDTLRRDHSSVYGYENDTTPGLRKVAHAGARFDLAYSPSPQTGPAHASIFTGLYPISHRLVKNGLALADRHETLAEVFGAHGYQTAGFVSSFVLDGKFGWNQGFAEYHDDFKSSDATVTLDSWAGHTIDAPFDAKSDTTTRLATQWLWERRDRQRPFFLFVHYFDPHAPYVPPKDYARRIAPPEPDPTGGIRADFDWRMAVRNYDGEILFADREIERLLEVLDAEGLTTNTLVVITADHGEGLMDHQLMTHGTNIYEEQVRVPLLFRWPGKIAEGGSWTEPVELIDLTPTIRDLVGIPAAAEQYQGRSLAPALLEKAALDPMHPVFLHRPPFEPGTAEGIRVAGEQFGVRVGKWKYIEADQENTKELFNLDLDDRELINRFDSEPARAAELAEMLTQWRQSLPTGEPIDPIAPDDLEALRALGYVE